MKPAQSLKFQDFKSRAVSYISPGLRSALRRGQTRVRIGERWPAVLDVHLVKREQTSIKVSQFETVWSRWELKRVDGHTRARLAILSSTLILVWRGFSCMNVISKMMETLRAFQWKFLFLFSMLLANESKIYECNDVISNEDSSPDSSEYRII